MSDLVHERNGIPENAVIQAEIEIVSYFDENGSLRINWRGDGNVPVSTVLGLLEQTKMKVLNSWDEQSGF